MLGVFQDLNSSLYYVIHLVFFNRLAIFFFGGGGCTNCKRFKSFLFEYDFYLPKGDISYVCWILVKWIPRKSRKCICLQKQTAN